MRKDHSSIYHPLILVKKYTLFQKSMPFSLDELRHLFPTKCGNSPCSLIEKTHKKYRTHGLLLESLPDPSISWEVRMSRNSSKHRCHCKVLEQADMVLFHVITCMFEAERFEKVRKIFKKETLHQTPWTVGWSCFIFLICKMNASQRHSGSQPFIHHALKNIQCNWPLLGTFACSQGRVEADHHAAVVFWCCLTIKPLYWLFHRDPYNGLLVPT